MAIMLFTALNGLGIVFLVYVFVQFWNEGRKSNNRLTTVQVIEFAVKDRPTVFVVMHPVSHCAHGGLSVVSSRVRLSSVEGKAIYANAVGEVNEMPVKHFSSR